MSEFPTTQLSLLVRLRDPEDQLAWDEFAAIYRPVVVRYACRRGLQQSDAEDLAQTVLSAVAARVEDWRPDPERARFRSWLLTIAQRQTVSILRRRRVDAAHGGTTATRALQDQPDSQDDVELQSAWQRQVFRELARQIRDEFQETTWQAFWFTAVEQQAVPDVAARLGLSTGAVYTARSRIIRRLQDRWQQSRQDWSLTPAESEVQDD